jgi:uncharacterized protein YggE
MRTKPQLSCAVGCLLMIALCSAGAQSVAVSAQIQAQQAAGGAPDSITGIGMSTIRRAPDRMRLMIQLPVEGKTLKEALAKMAQRKEAAKKKLVALGVAEQDVLFEDLRPETTNPQQLMEQAMKARMGMAKKPAPPAGPANVRLVVTLKAHWALAGKSPEELLAASQELQQKVKDADLSELKQASAEDRERLEEQQGGSEINFNFGMPASPPPGEPAFSFVCKIPDEEMTKATEEAFKTAKSKAQQLARGAGVELGNLKQLTSYVVPDVDPSQPSYLQMMQAAGAAVQPSGDDPNEAAGIQPTQIKVRLTVMASFGIK